MAVEKFEILRRETYWEGRQFGTIGAYDRIDAIAHYAIDPELPTNQKITDLGLADTIDGKVHFKDFLTLSASFALESIIAV